MLNCFAAVSVGSQYGIVSILQPVAVIKVAIHKLFAADISFSLSFHDAFMCFYQ